MSAEARALGHRPPAGSLAALAQSAADRHPAGGSFAPASPVELAVLKDAAILEGERLREREQQAQVEAEAEVKEAEEVGVEVEVEAKTE